MKELEGMMAWGQYIHWSHLQIRDMKDAAEKYNDADFFGISAHCYAVQYVVIEGWKQLDFSDEIIDELLEKYPEYVDILRRCRNAVYHYQHKAIDKRILAVLKEKESFAWLHALNLEFERFLYMYPFQRYGYHQVSLDLQSEYFGAIGWEPEENLHVRIFKLSMMVNNYELNNAMNKLDVNTDNNALIEDTKKVLNSLDATVFCSSLSRM